MRKLVAVLSLYAAVLLPSVSQAFTLHTPRFDADSIECSVVNVGKINLVANVGLYGDDGVRTQGAYGVIFPGASVWIRTSGLTYKRCDFRVRAQIPGKTATRDMVRAAVVFRSSSGYPFSFEAK